MASEPLELRTHTGLWRIEKKLYKLYDFTLPMPVSIRQLGTVAGVGIPWMILMKVLHVPFHPPFQLVWFAPPALVAWWANKPVAEGKRLLELLFSQGTYAMQSKFFAGMRPFRPDRVMAVRSEIWHPAGAPHIDGPPAVPLPTAWASPPIEDPEPTE